MVHSLTPHPWTIGMPPKSAPDGLQSVYMAQLVKRDQTMSSRSVQISNSMSFRNMVVPLSCASARTPCNTPLLSSGTTLRHERLNVHLSARNASHSSHLDEHSNANVMVELT